MDYNKDYYGILGIKKNATKKEIESAYRKMMKKWHPDLFASKSKEEQEKANAMSSDINEAHDVLSDEAQRSEYDMVRAHGGRSGMFMGGMDMDGFSPFGERANAFHEFHKRRAERNPIKGKTIGIHIELPFEDFFFGSKKILDVKVHAKCTHCKNGLTDDNPVYEDCPFCGGTGMRMWNPYPNMVCQETCSRCDGTGKMLNNKCPYCGGTSIIGDRIQTIEFEIPKDSRHTVSHMFIGVGHGGLYGGEPGDIAVTATMNANGMFFYRDANTLGTLHYVSLFKALAGGTEAILTPYGKKNILLPSGMESGHEIRFGGMGLKGLNGEPDGDLVVTFKYDMPKYITTEIADEMNKAAKKASKLKKCFENVEAENEYVEKYLKKLG